MKYDTLFIQKMRGRRRGMFIGNVYGGAPLHISRAQLDAMIEVLNDPLVLPSDVLKVTPRGDTRSIKVEP